jgi:hypothetical protein
MFCLFWPTCFFFFATNVYQKIIAPPLGLRLVAGAGKIKRLVSHVIGQVLGTANPLPLIGHACQYVSPPFQE